MNIYGCLRLEKTFTEEKWEKSSVLNNGAGTIRHQYRKKILKKEQNCILTSHYVLKYEMQKINILDDNIGGNLQPLELEKISWTTQKISNTRKNDKSDYVKIKNFLFVRIHQELKANHRGLKSKICTRFLEIKIQIT